MKIGMKILPRKYHKYILKLQCVRIWYVFGGILVFGMFFRTARIDMFWLYKDPVSSGKSFHVVLDYHVK